MRKTDLARKYRQQYGAKMPTLKLARIMYKENNLLFKDVEDARSSLRYIEGKQGVKDKKHILKNNSEFIVKENRPYNPYNLPESDAESFEPYHIKGHKRGLIIGDIHLPYQNNEAITACLNYAKKQSIDFILINGDLCDFHQLSYFMKDPRKKRFSEELQIMTDFFAVLKKTFKCKIYFKFGNHEERYESFLYQKAHELIGVDDFSLETIVKKRVHDIEVIRDKRLVVINGLPIIHGHEFGRGVFNPVNASRGLFLQAKHSCVKGDCHTTSEHTEPDIYRKIMTTFSVGCLCGLTPKWLPLNKWNHGFAIIDLIGDNEYNFRNYRIYEGKVL